MFGKTARTPSRRSLFAVLGGAVAAVVLLATAAAAQFILVGDDDYVSLSNPTLNYTFRTLDTKSYARTFPVTRTTYGPVTVSGPTSVTIPANSSIAYGTFTFSHATAASEVQIRWGDTNYLYGNDVYFE